MKSHAVTARGASLGLMALLYLFSGVAEKPFEWGATVAYAAAKGLPLPALLVAGSVLIEVLAPLALLVERWRPPAALVLALYTLLTALLFHDFWAADAAAAQNQLQHFMKNIALTGAWFYVFIEAREAVRNGTARPVVAGRREGHLLFPGREAS